MPKKVPFTVVHCSGADEGHSARELELSRFDVKTRLPFKMAQVTVKETIALFHYEFVIVNLVAVNVIADPHDNMYDDPLDPDPEDQSDERPLPALNKSKPAEEDEEDTENSPLSSDGPEPLKDNDARIASSAIAVFGEHLVQCAYSKQWKFRQEAMEQLDKEMTSESPELSNDQDPRSVSRATVFLVKKGIKEKVQSVFLSCLTVLRSLLLTYIPKHKLGKGETQQVLEKVVPALVLKSGEMTPRSREAAIDMIIEIAKYEDALPLGIVPDVVTQPIKRKPPTPWRLLKSKLETIEKLLGVLELDKNKPGSLHSASIMQVTVTALDHSHGEVRDAAVNLIFLMYKKVGEPIKSYLPADEPSTRKSPLYRSIFDGFDKIDGKPTESERRAQAKLDRKQAEKTKQAEIEALQAQLQALRDMAQGGGETNPDPKTTKAAKKTQDEPPVDVDRMCIFCGEKNQSFTEEVLDLHYWKSCPMLKRCDHCSQVVEVSGFNEHLLTECDAKDKFSQCPRCKDVMLTVDLEEHISDNKCTAPKGSKDAQRCPLCRTVIGDGEEAWYSHLMDNCKPNKLRLQQQQASKAPSRASVRSNRGRGGKATPSTRGAARGRKGNLPR
ncbi:Centrosomal protein of 104 kDa [Exaiptasia diaphana]|nr:Centrosomal protein of 104 kDa [Exaiptasia diaphana]